MSGTRSHSPKAPAIDALIVAHGQPSDPEPAEAALAALTRRVQAHCPELRLGSATLANGTALEQATATLCESGAVYPLFMSNGWFVKTALRKRLGETPCEVMLPLGLEAELPDIAAEAISQALQEQGLSSKQTHVLLAAHGSARGGAAAKSAFLFARQLAHRLPLASVSPAFVEQAPFVQDMARDIGSPALCLPFFAMDGDHMKQDVRGGLAEAGFDGAVLPALGQLPGIAALIADSLRMQLSDKEAA